MSGGGSHGFPDGGLAAALEARTRAALACGALRPIETEQAEIDDGGVRFLVRVVSSLARKAERPQAGARPARRPTPFCPRSRS